MLSIATDVLTANAVVFQEGGYAPSTLWVSSSRLYFGSTATALSSTGITGSTGPTGSRFNTQTTAVSPTGEVVVGGTFTTVNGVIFASPRVALYRPMTVFGSFLDKFVTKSGIVLYNQFDRIKCMWYENAWIVTAGN